MKRLLQFLSVSAIYILTLPLALIPYRLSLRVGSALGVLGYSLWSSRRKIAIKNIEGCMKAGSIDSVVSPSALAKESFKNLGKSIMEIVRIYHGMGEVILKNTEIDGVEHYLSALKKGKGILLVTGHCGNWEVLALVSSYKVNPLAVVARAINNPYLNRLVERVRRKYGNRIIYKKGALREIIRELRRGGSVGILIDQSVLPSEGVKIPFLGRAAWTMRTPAVIAAKTGASVVPAFIQRTSTGHKIKVYPEVELVEGTSEDSVVENTKRISSYVEGYIKENPSEWLWIHRRWKRT